MIIVKLANNVVINKIDFEDKDSLSHEEIIRYLGLDESWSIRSDNENISVGQLFLPEQNKFAPLNKRKNFVFDQTLWMWVPPISPPEDATWVTDIQTIPEGHEELEIKRVYSWSDKYQAWALSACGCNPKPDDGLEYGWNYLTYSWDLAPNDSPGEMYFWDPVEKLWLLAEQS